MFEEPQETPEEKPKEPATAAREKADEFFLHAQLAAVFEGGRKFDAQIIPGLNPQIARDIQRTIGKLEKAKSADSPLLPPTSAEDAARILDLPATAELSTNDYQIHRRPGEVMIARWLEGEDVATFYQRLQAHFDAAMEHCREEEKVNHGWKQDPATIAYLAALDGINVTMDQRYLRDIIRKHQVFILSTYAADEMNIQHLCDYIMGVPVAEVVGEQSAPPEEPTEQDLAWYFKLFSLRGMKKDVEQMCFFTYMQKSEESW